MEVKMILAVGSDERNAMTDALIENLRQNGHQLLLFGPVAEEQTAWPGVARQVAEAVAGGQAEEGILCCWTGTGVSLAANKVPGVRAALCADAETARGARLWNNANILCLSLRRTTPALAGEILEQWFKTHYQPNPEDDACLAEVDALEKAYRSGEAPHSGI
jgi:ribose 5-phosphate isomerase B